MRIMLLFEPPPDRAIPFAAGPERYQRLADELSRYAGAQVQIVKDVLRKAPADTYLLFAGGGDVSRSLADCGPGLAAQLAPRIVLLDVSWQKALEQLEKHRLAGAVDSLRLSEWLARPSSCTGPFGLRYLAKPLGASCVPIALVPLGPLLPAAEQAPSRDASPPGELPGRLRPRSTAVERRAFGVLGPRVCGYSPRGPARSTDKGWAPREGRSYFSGGVCEHQAGNRLPEARSRVRPDDLAATCGKVRP